MDLNAAGAALKALPKKLGLNYKSTITSEDSGNSGLQLFGERTVNNHYHHPKDSKPIELNIRSCKPKDPIATFTGRKDVIEKLCENIGQSMSQDKNQGISKVGGISVNSLIQVLSGVPGAGKTQTARKYILEHKQEYDYVIWIDAEEYDNARKCFLRIAEDSHIKITDKMKKSDQDIAEAVYNVACHKKCLFVFDNVEENASADSDTKNKNEKRIRNLMPKSIDYLVPPVFIVTTRYSDWERIPAIIFKGFSDEECWELLKGPLKLEDNPGNRRLVQVVTGLCDGLPLVLQQVIAFIIKENMFHRFTLKDFVTDADLQRLIKEEPEDSDIKRSVAAIYKLITKKLSSTTIGKSAINILDVMALLDPDGIPRELLRNLMKNTKAENDFIAALRLLKDYGLVVENNDSYEIHRIVQLVRRKSTSFTVQTETGVIGILKQPKNIFSTCTSVLEILKNYTEYVNNITGNYSETTVYQVAKNGLTFIENVKDDISVDAVLQFIDSVADNLPQLAWDVDLRKAVKIVRELSKKDTGSVETICERKIKLANICRTAHLKLLGELSTDVITEENSLGPTHPIILNAMELRAYYLFHFDRNLDKSAQLYEEVRRRRQESLGSYHKDNLTTIINIAYVYNEQNKIEEARKLYMEVIPQIVKQRLTLRADILEMFTELASGFEENETLNEAKKVIQWMNNEKLLHLIRESYLIREIYPGVVAYGKNSPIEAHTIFKQVVSEWENELDPRHFGNKIRMIYTWESMAAVLEYYQHYDKAENIYLRLLSKFPDSDDGVNKTIKWKHELAWVYIRKNQYAEAEKFFKDVLPDLRKQLVIDDSESWESRNERALSYENKENYYEAEQIYKYNIMMNYIEEVRNGQISSEREHGTVSNLARALTMQHKYGELAVLYHQKVTGFETCSGRTHENTLDAIIDLAVVFFHYYKYDASEKNLLRVLSTREASLMPNHAKILETKLMLAIIYCMNKEHDRGKKLYQEVVLLQEGSEEVAGFCWATVCSLAELYYKHFRPHDEKHKNNTTMKPELPRLKGLFEKQLGEKTLKTALTLVKMSYYLSDCEEMESLLEPWLKTGNIPEAVLDAMTDAAVMTYNERKLDESNTSVLSLREETVVPIHGKVRRKLMLAVLNYVRKEYDTAEKCYEDCISLREEPEEGFRWSTVHSVIEMYYKCDPRYCETEITKFNEYLPKLRYHFEKQRCKNTLKIMLSLFDHMWFFDDFYL